MLLMGSSFMKGSVLDASGLGEARRPDEPGGEIVEVEAQERSRSAFGGSVEEKPMKY